MGLCLINYVVVIIVGCMCMVHMMMGMNGKKVESLPRRTLDESGAMSDLNITWIITTHGTHNRSSLT